MFVGMQREYVEEAAIIESNWYVREGPANVGVEYEAAGQCRV